MKYSLRSLIIGITLICVLLGGRIEYLRRQADYHRREETIQTSKLREASDVVPERSSAQETHWAPKEDRYEDAIRLLDCVFYHQEMQRRYEKAVLRPWTIVEERPGL